MTLRILAIFLSCIFFVGNSFADFAIRDGDTVVFLGDSITAARQYTKLIETYTLLRFPERRVKFINAGHGGETAKGCLARLDKDVFQRGATLVTVAYGINDIGWGMKADEAHRKEYLDAIAELIDRCHQHNVRVFICSAAITAEAPDTAENGFLQRMCDDGLALAKAKHAGTIDVQRTMREVQRRVFAANAAEPDKTKQTRLHVDDSIHLNELGQLAMGFAILKGLGAPSEVSTAEIDAASGTVVNANHCRITRLASKPDTVSFTRFDDGLPLNLQPLWTLHQRFIPFADINHYMLKVTNLSSGDYEILAGGRLLGKWNAGELAAGINIASATSDPWQPGGPWDAQAHAVKIYTDMRDESVFARRGMNDALVQHPKLKSLDRETETAEQQIIKLQRDTARPVPVQFEIRKITKK